MNAKSELIKQTQNNGIKLYYLKISNTCGGAV